MNNDYCVYMYIVHGEQGEVATLSRSWEPFEKECIKNKSSFRGNKWYNLEQLQNDWWEYRKNTEKRDFDAILCDHCMWTYLIRKALL